MHSTTNIHHVVAVKVEAQAFTGEHAFVSTQFTFVDADGGEITVSAFSKDFLTIEGAEHVNHVAQPVEEAAAYEPI